VATAAKVTTNTPAQRGNSEDEEAGAESMAVEGGKHHANQYNEDAEALGPAMEESEKMAEADWEQLGKATKKKKTRETLVSESKRTCMQAKLWDYVRACRTDAQEREREYNKRLKRRENKRMMPQIPPPPPQPVEEVTRTRLMQVWWLENEISAAYHIGSRAHIAHCEKRWRT
jgi:hypothetical protein